MTEQSVICGNKQPDKVKPMAKVEAKGSGIGREAFSTTFFSIHVIISNDLACSNTSNTKYIECTVHK